MIGSIKAADLMEGQVGETLKKVDAFMWHFFSLKCLL